MKLIKDKCVNCGKNRKLKPNKLCTCCNSKQTKCISCNRKPKKNATVVLKVLKDSANINTAFLKELQNIVESQPNSSGRQLIQSYGVSQDPNTNNYIFVMSYMSHGSLNEYLSSDFKNITWRMKQNFLRHIVKGIKWIHENKIIHRDIHGGNILINIVKRKRYYSEYSESFVADLGFSRPAKEDPKNSEIYGIMSYIAPEVFRKKQYSFSSDIYSLGMIMWQLTSGHRPFCDREYNVDLALSICDGSRPEITEDTPQCWNVLMQKCWFSEPLERPSISEMYSEINSSYWNVDKIFTEAENKRQELFKSGKFIAKHMHPHSKTHSKLLTPIIDSLLSSLDRKFKFSTSGSVNSFQNIGSDSSCIM
ncbi:kinase-like domain-containing protein [Gigaspora rosea]|uniref:Kinase-like domain-containing protein n=1 Tax=Gigaspora rosea TaxID=44941 RepID=A0A397UN17_9GLOM|nr:kinase-like domain-containing protein [Gigaspora rosea]